jgi:hypothetical protein
MSQSSLTIGQTELQGIFYLLLEKKMNTPAKMPVCSDEETGDYARA